MLAEIISNLGLIFANPGLQRRVKRTNKINQAFYCYFQKVDDSKRVNVRFLRLCWRQNRRVLLQRIIQTHLQYFDKMTIQSQFDYF